MSKVFPIDFVRQIIEQTLAEQHFADPKYIGGVNEVSLFSFYEQLQQQDELDRFTERYRDLINQQNRTGLIANGVIVAPENPTITNINQATVIPMTFTVTFRCTLADRDRVLESLYNMISILKGRKHDIAEFESGKLLKVGTFGNNVNGKPLIKSGDYIGSNIADGYAISSKISTLVSNGFEQDSNIDWLYASEVDGETGKETMVVYKLYRPGPTWYKYTDSHKVEDIIFPPEDEQFEKWKVSISFDSFRCDEPRTLNAEEYCQISFGGSATLTNAKIRLGNDILKVGIEKYKIKGSPDISLTTTPNTIYWLEPLEIPNSNNANTKPNQLISNAFKTNSHTDSINITLQYTFLVDTSISIIEKWYDYARYGEIDIDTTYISTNHAENVMSPNLIYRITEIYNTWGEWKKKQFKAKAIESIDNDNTESDVLTLTIPFQLQGDND